MTSIRVHQQVNDIEALQFSLDAAPHRRPKSGEVVVAALLRRVLIVRLPIDDHIP